MEPVSQIMSFLGAAFEHLSQQTEPTNSTAIAASIIVLSVLSTAPSRLSELFGTVAVAMLGVLLFFVSNYAMVLFVVGCGIVGIVRSRRKSAAIERQLDKMGRSIQQLELVENRLLMRSLNSTSSSVAKKHQQDTPSITPGGQIDSAKDPAELHVVRQHR
jgi:hypothetical protein